MSLRSLYIDFNSYFASVEQELQTELRGKPIGVVPVMADTTCCIAASYEAKAFGVKTGTLVKEAKLLCPEILLVEARPTLYVDYHHRLVTAVESCLPVDRVNSIDEMACILTGSQQQRFSAEQLAYKIKTVIATQVGAYLKCSIGIASNEFLAKTASDMHKPDGLTIIEPVDLPHCLYRLKLRDLCGIGPRMEARLQQQGIHTVQELCAADIHAMRHAWNGIEGERMYALLRGDAVPRPPTQRASLSHSHVLAPELRTQRTAYSVLHRLTQKAAMRLRDYHYLTGALAISLKYRDGRKWEASRFFDATDETLTFLTALRELWRSRPPWAKQATPLAVGMAFSRLMEKSFMNRLLFSNYPRREKLDQAIDQLNLRYGKNTLYYGGAHLALHAAPMRIAFNHIPDLRVESDD